MVNRLLASVAALLLVSTVLLAQSAAGLAGISGVVRDASGAYVANAKVVVSNQAMGIARNLASNDAGIFTAPALPPASGYSVVVTVPGFAPWEVKDIELLVGQNISLSASLQVASSTTQVQVTGEAPIVEGTKTDVSEVIGTKQIMELPINGRRVDAFVLMAPGVTADGAFGLLSFRGIAGGNAFLVDGADTTQQFYNENAGRTRIQSQLSQEAVQEFQVLSSSFSAEYGRASGGVVNTVIKSGTNDVHGTGFWFFRNRTLNARDPLSTVNPPEVRHQAGGSVGGKLIKDKLFYFLASEISHRNYPIASSQVKPGVIDQNAQTWLGCGTPVTVNGASYTPTASQCGAINGILPRLFGVVPRQLNQQLALGKLDWRPTDRNSFSATFNFLHDKSPNGLQSAISLTNGSGVAGNGDDSVRVRTLKLSWTAIPTTSMVNEVRFSWYTDREADDFSKGALAPGIGYVQLTVAQVSNLGAGLNYLPRVDPNERRFQYADNLSWTKGKHIFKFGADISFSRDYDYFISNQWGTYTYGSTSAFALDYSANTAGLKSWQTFSQTFGNPVTDSTINDYGFYAQDQFRVTSKLTVNYGVRYEFASLPQPPQSTPDYPQTGVIPESYLNFAPRIGLAYSLDKTVVRAGYGMYYARFPGGFINDLWKNNGLYQTTLSLSSSIASQLAAGPVYPNRLPNSSSAAGSSTIQFAAPNLRTPYTEQGDFAIERQLSSQMSLTTSYIWSRGVRLYSTRDLNIGPLSSASYTYRINDASGNQVGAYSTQVYQGPKVNPKYNRIIQDENGQNSSYNALVLQLRKRFSKGFQGGVSYTWSHAIDDNQGGGSSNLFFAGVANTYNGDYKFDKGNSSLDQRHKLTINFIEQPTFTHRDGAFYKYVVNNWQLSVLTTLASGRPDYGSINIQDSRAPNGGLNFSLNGFGGLSRVPFWPMNSLLTGATYRADARLTKLIPFSERYKLSLLFEAFNITNTPVFGGIFDTAYNELNGALNPLPVGGPRADSLPPDGTSARRAQVGVRFVF
jgi:Carboxypeptidase regulatory-like domain/TonB dependent receptor